MLQMLVLLQKLWKQNNNKKKIEVKIFCGGGRGACEILDNLLFIAFKSKNYYCG